MSKLIEGLPLLIHSQHFENPFQRFEKMKSSHFKLESLKGLIKFKLSNFYFLLEFFPKYCILWLIIATGSL